MTTRFQFFVTPLLLFVFSTCSPQKASEAQTVGSPLPYDLENPSLSINLVSDALQEISGLSPTDRKGVYLAIADERGEIFWIDGDGGGAVLQRVLFREKGDFEGVEMAEGKLWAVKSDGHVFEIDRWNDPAPIVQEYDTPLQKNDDVEGLGYDPGRKALLLACKGNPDSAYLRKIYAFDLKFKQLSPTPVYAIDPLEINRMVPYIDSEKQDYFSPSGIAVHPQTQEIYVTSSALKRLAVLDPKTGKLRYAVRLNKKILPQPEGIAFDKNGNLFLSSEGKKGQGLMFRFDYVKK